MIMRFKQTFNDSNHYIFALETNISTVVTWIVPHCYKVFSPRYLSAIFVTKTYNDPSLEVNPNMIRSKKFKREVKFCIYFTENQKSQAEKNPDKKPFYFGNSKRHNLHWAPVLLYKIHLNVGAAKPIQKSQNFLHSPESSCCIWNRWNLYSPFR